MTVDISSLLAEKEWVRALARNLLFDPDRADDVVQETWLAALVAPPRQSSSLRGWLRSVVRNQSHRVLRAEHRRRDREREVARTEVEPNLEVDEHLDLHQRLAEAIVELDSVHRTVIYLRYFRDQTLEAIGRETGVPSATVRSQHRRALERLRQAIASDHVLRRSSALSLFVLAGLDPSVFSSIPATSVATAGTGAAASLTVGGAVMSGKTAIVSFTMVVLATATGVLYYQSNDAKEEAKVARKASETQIADHSERVNRLAKKLDALKSVSDRQAQVIEELRETNKALDQRNDELVQRIETRSSTPPDENLDVSTGPLWPSAPYLVRDDLTEEELSLLPDFPEGLLYKRLPNGSIQYLWAYKTLKGGSLQLRPDQLGAAEQLFECYLECSEMEDQHRESGHYRLGGQLFDSRDEAKKYLDQAVEKLGTRKGLSLTEYGQGRYFVADRRALMNDRRYQELCVQKNSAQKELGYPSDFGIWQANPR